MSGLYYSNGAINVTVVTSTTLTGLYALDGSYNVSLADGTNRGLYAPGGSLRVTVAANTAANSKRYAPDGSYYVTETYGAPKGALFIHVVSGSLSGGVSNPGNAVYGLGGLFGTWS